MQVRLADVVERAETPRFNSAKWLSTVLVCTKPPSFTYSSAE